MRILSVIAQKPMDTGSGIYLTELVQAFDAMGHLQAVVAGMTPKDITLFPSTVSFYPVYFETEMLPFPIAGMSDTMPYQSTRYSEMPPAMIAQMKYAFLRALEKAVDEFHPEVLLCHHLFLLTSWVKEAYPKLPIVGLCHGTDLRQITTHPAFLPQIAAKIAELDRIFALQAQQKETIASAFGISPEKIFVIGAGYNSKIFNKRWLERWKTPTIIYAGKLSEQKGVSSLLRSMKWLKTQACLKLAGGGGSPEETDSLKKLAAESPIPVEFLGRLNQDHLAEAFQKSAVFVLPSFYEGLPLVLLEAMACGVRVVCTDLPGVRPWLDENLPFHQVHFVPMPAMERPGSPCADALLPFEIALAQALEEALVSPPAKILPGLAALSWQGTAQRILDMLPVEKCVNPQCVRLQ